MGAGRGSEPEPSGRRPEGPREGRPPHSAPAGCALSFQILLDTRALKLVRALRPLPKAFGEGLDGL